jgi:hypothetical protein
MDEAKSPLQKNVDDANGTVLHQCKTCGAPPREHEMRNFDPVGRYADIYCTRCGGYVRDWDPN